MGKLDLTNGKILSPLLRFAMPVLFALFLQAMYGAVDLLVVGKFQWVRLMFPLFILKRFEIT